MSVPTYPTFSANCDYPEFNGGKKVIEQLTARVRELEYQLNTEIGSYASARIAELEEENARLRFALADTEALELGTSERLAASQAYAEQLRKWVIDNCMHADTCDSLSLDDEGKHMACSCGLTAALAFPRDTSALDAYVANQREAAYQEARKAAAQFEAELARQRDLAVDALERVARYSRQWAQDVVGKTTTIIRESEK